MQESLFYVPALIIALALAAAVGATWVDSRFSRSLQGFPLLIDTSVAKGSPILTVWPEPAEPDRVQKASGPPRCCPRTASACGARRSGSVSWSLPLPWNRLTCRPVTVAV